MKRLFVFDGKGRCLGAQAFVLGETLEAARARLLCSDACSYFDIADEGRPLRVALPTEPSGGDGGR